MKSCEKRIDENLRMRLDDLQKLWTAYCDGEEEIEDLGSIYDYGLCFDYIPAETFEDQKEPYFRYQLSWGGPSDEFRFYTGPDLIPYKIEYVFLDWFDGAKRELKGEDFDLLFEIFEWFKESGTLEHVLQH